MIDRAKGAVLRLAMTALLLIVTTAGAQAVPITVSESQSQTTAGQNLLFTLDGADGILPPAPAATGIFLFTFSEIDVTGTLANSTESFSIDIDGLIMLGPLRRADIPAADYTIIDGGNANFTFEVPVSSAVLASMLGDLMVAVEVDLGSGVAVLGTTNEIAVALTYNTPSAVPEPAGLAVFGAGLAVLCLLRRRRATA
ncbi:PEP-CTERM sorting domain-containing protein [Pelagibius sp.]|uniref:PEP-CTERM sorting domain-containing protein n=1 Tax=Pelagibius sp. TaxID=1931238 RepID=UPI002619527D|nr:PEP-CTERM sorting domain-containing protein [Pelagibius sp.]